MSRYLSNLLEAQEPVFSEAIRQLEDASGRGGADVKLIGDITARAHQAMRTLGLHPAGSTGPELYNGLLARVEADNRQLARIIGAEEARRDEIRYMQPFVIDAALKVKYNKKVFVLRRDSAAKLLQKVPPKVLLEHLAFDSVEGLLQHEDIDEVFAALRFSESKNWLESYAIELAKLTPADYEERDIRVFAMGHTKYVDLADDFVRSREHPVVHSKEMGVVALAPMKSRKMRGFTLRVLPTIFHYFNELKTYSAFFKTKQSEPNFGAVVADMILRDPSTGSSLAGKQIHWRVIQRYLSETSDEVSVGSRSLPHIQTDDLYWRRAEELLFMVDPELEFWQGLDYVGLHFDGAPISFNLFDVSIEYMRKEKYEHRSSYHFRASLWNEIFIRYMGFNSLANQVLANLNTPSVVPGYIPVIKATQPKQSKVRRSASQRNMLIRKRLIDSAEGRLVTVVDEFEQVFEILSKYEKTVTIFGSARKPQDDEVTMSAYEMSARMSREGFAVITGGGNGVMEAANRGAYEAGGDSLGFNIQLPFEQKLNEYTTEDFQFKHFFGRKVAMTLDSSAFIYFPGGFGTFDELFEVVTLMQTRKIDRAPIVLIGSDFWRPFDTAIRQVMLDKYQTIEYEDLDLYRIYDDYDSAIAYINESYTKEMKERHS